MSVSFPQYHVTQNTCESKWYPWVCGLGSPVAEPLSLGGPCLSILSSRDHESEPWPGLSCSKSDHKLLSFTRSCVLSTFFYTHLVSTLKEKKTVYCMFYLPLNLRAVFLACKPFFVLQLRVIVTGKQAAQDTLFLLWLVI